jgi:hypothetical protein
MPLPTIPYDKALHVTYGAAIGLVGALTAFYFSLPMWTGAIAAALLFAVAKEARDLISRRGTPDILDAVATLAGAVPCALVAWLAP